MDELEKNRSAYTIRPFELNGYAGDSGRIDGREGLARVIWGMPIMGEDGRFLEFETFEAAEIEAINRGFTAENVCHDHIVLVYPTRISATSGG